MAGKDIAASVESSSLTGPTASISVEFVVTIVAQPCTKKSASCLLYCGYPFSLDFYSKN